MVASYGWDRQTIEGPHKGETRLVGSFQPNDTSAPTAAMLRGALIESVAYAATGVWTVTIAERFRKCPRVLACFVKARFGALEDLGVQCGELDMDAGTIVIRGFAISTGAAATIDDDDDNWIDIELVLKYNTAPDGSNF